MIFVDRADVPEPTVLESAAAKEELKRAHYFFTHEPGSKGHGRFVFAVHRNQQVEDSLRELFLGKCAYCESLPKSAQHLTVDHYRPTRRCVDEKGTLFPVHYWWLANEWTNLYASCPFCDQAKRNRFPIRGERAPSVEVEVDVLDVDAVANLVADRVIDHDALHDLEQPLLLDPCRRQDNPEQHFIYTDDGVVMSDTDEGRLTIRLLKLNRRYLRDARRALLRRLNEHIDPLRALLETAPDDIDRINGYVQDITAMIQPGEEYAGMCRQFARRVFDEIEAQKPGTIAPIADLSRTRAVTDDERQRAADEFEAQTRIEADAPGLEDASAVPGEGFYLDTGLIQKIVLHNIRPIRDLTIELAKGEDVPWLMLLGENACGKSTILKAIALALMGPKYREHLGIEARDFLRYGETDGHIHVQLSDGSVQALGFNASDDKIVFDGAGQQRVFFLAYGATRLLPRKNVERKQEDEEEIVARKRQFNARAENLFDPFEPLEDATAWLLNLEDAEFSSLKPALRKLMNLGPGDDIKRNDTEGQIELTLFGDTFPLNQASDGYQTVIAFAAEIMSILAPAWEYNMAAAEGIVLVDEVGSHLHPAWKMKIISAVREAFPSVQFIVSTHDPLCLRGMGDGEVVVMKRDQENRIMAITDLPNPATMRVDQILLSEFFGLHDTIADETNKLFNDYYELLREDDPSKEPELAKLRAELDAIGARGDDERQREMLDAIDRYLAKREVTRVEERDALTTKTRKMLDDLWETLEEGE